MKPIFNIVVSDPAREGWSSDITQAMASRLLDLSIEENSGMANDRVTIRLDDSTSANGTVVELPQKGFIFDIQLGYDDSGSEVSAGDKLPFNGLCPMGGYILDEIEVEGGADGQVIALTAHVLDTTNNTFKEQRTTEYHRTYIKDMVKQCCDRNNLTAIVHKDFQDIYVDHITQNAETDIYFLTRLGRMYGCSVKPQKAAQWGVVGQGTVNLYFCPPEKLQELQDLSHDNITIDFSSVHSWRYLSQGKSQFTSVKARYYDYDSGKMEWAVAEMDPSIISARGLKPMVAQLQPVFANATQAMQAAQSRMASLQRSLDSLSFVCDGNPNLLSGGYLTLTGFRTGVPTDWFIDRTTHRFTGSGYITECACVLYTPGTPRYTQQKIQRTPRTLRPVR